MSYPSKTTDSFGLVEDNSYLTVFIPASQLAIPFRVLARHNRGGEVLNYGALPITAAETWGSYDGGTTTAPADDVIPSRGFTNTAKSFTPPVDMSTVYDSSDMWYIPYDFRERLFHVKMEVTPSLIRCGVQIPKGQNQQRFQRDRAVLGVDKISGFNRGSLEMIHFPEVRIGYTFGNDTNLDLFNTVKFTYGEYMIGIPGDAELIYNILDKRVPSHWVTLPIATYDSAVKVGLQKDYGIEGFNMYSPEERRYAIEEYQSVIEKINKDILIVKKVPTDSSPGNVIRRVR